MSLEKIDCPSLHKPLAIPIYSHAVKIPGVIYTSGQIGTGDDGKLVSGGLVPEIIQTVKNLGVILEDAGSSWEKVIKVNVFLKNINDFAELNTIYEKLLPTPKPARTCIQAILPLEAVVEMEVVAQA